MFQKWNTHKPARFTPGGLFFGNVPEVEHLKARKSPNRLRQSAMRGAMRRMSNMHVSAYMRELGRKGGKATGDKKKRSPEHYAKMAAASAIARRKKNAAQ